MMRVYLTQKEQDDIEEAVGLPGKPRSRTLTQYMQFMHNLPYDEPIEVVTVKDDLDRQNRLDADARDTARRRTRMWIEAILWFALGLTLLAVATPYLWEYFHAR